MITFETYIFSYFYMTKAVIPFMKEGDSIIDTLHYGLSWGAFIIYYSATKGAATSFTRSLSSL
jgi:NAD(P)-dependent dehydrogenase (short-subunit alcohol dehydrogenase family)